MQAMPATRAVVAMVGVPSPTRGVSVGHWWLRSALRMRWREQCSASPMETSGQSGLAPVDLDGIGTKYSVAPFWLEEIVAMLGSGASTPEILTGLRTPEDGTPSLRTFPLTDEQATPLIAEMRALIVSPSDDQVPPRMTMVADAIEHVK